MSARTVAAISGFLAVLLGAFGAHTLKGSFSPEQAEWWKTAVLYHLVHAAVTLVSGTREGRASLATWCFAAGTALFSGSLYAMSVGAPRWFGAITPVGGLAFLAGWLLLTRSQRP